MRSIEPTSPTATPTRRSTSAGVIAIVSAGLGVAVMSRSSVPDTLRVLGEDEGFPPLPPTSMALVLGDVALSPAAAAMVDLLREELGRDALAA